MLPCVHKHIVIDSVRLSYLEREATGAGLSQAPLLLLHGLLATAETFADLAAHLPSDRRIVALDLLSAQPLDPTATLPVDFGHLARMIRNFMQILQLENPVVIGHSHGGALTLRLAASERISFKGLVLMCPAHPYAGYRSHVVQFYLTRHGRALALSIPLAPKWMILRAFNEAAGPTSRIRMRHLQKYMRVLRNRSTLRRVLDMLSTWEVDMSKLRKSLEESPISLPTLLIWGDADSVVYIDSAPELKRRLSDSEQLTLPHMGHLLAEEAPDACGKAISEWMMRRVL